MIANPLDLAAHAITQQTFAAISRQHRRLEGPNRIAYDDVNRAPDGITVCNAVAGAFRRPARMDLARPVIGRSGFCRHRVKFGPCGSLRWRREGGATNCRMTASVNPLARWQIRHKILMCDKGQTVSPYG